MIDIYQGLFGRKMKKNYEKLKCMPLLSFWKEEKQGKDEYIALGINRQGTTIFGHD